MFLSPAIYTAAMEMLGGGDEVKAQCRSVDIMADAAYCMLTKDSKSYTGNFAIDDIVLGDSGINDMEQYSCVPGLHIIWYRECHNLLKMINTAFKVSKSTVKSWFLEDSGTRNLF